MAQGFALALLLAGFHRRGRYVLAEQHLHGLWKAGIEIFAHEINCGAAAIFILIKPDMPANGHVMADPFQLRAGALQLLTAGFEKGREVGLLGLLKLLGSERDKTWRCNHFQSITI